MESELSRKLEKVPGIGPNTAGALVATVGNAKSFDNARQLSAWLGLVPKQNSSGGKSVRLGISKRGDTYLRTLLIHGARSAILAAQRKADKVDFGWLGKLLHRRNHNVAAVALANRMLDWSGRCWPEIGNSDPTTQPLALSHSQVGGEEPTRTKARRSHH